MYANVINSPSSNVMADDVEVYDRCQKGNMTRGGEWISLHRYAGRDTEIDGGMRSTNGTSELPMRNQFKAWKHYMLSPGRAVISIAAGHGDSGHVCGAVEDSHVA